MLDASNRYSVISILALAGTTNFARKLHSTNPTATHHKTRVQITPLRFRHISAYSQHSQYGVSDSMEFHNLRRHHAIATPLRPATKTMFIHEEELAINFNNKSSKRTQSDLLSLLNTPLTTGHSART
jgi:hypothetical protein